MNWTSKTLPVLALGALVLVAGCGQKGGNVVAEVNGEPISMEQFHDALEVKNNAEVIISGQFLSGVMQLAQTNQVNQLVNRPVTLSTNGSIGFQVLQDLIKEKVVLQMAREEKVLPTAKEIDKELDFRNEITPNYVKIQKGNGINMGVLRRMVELELANERLLSKDQVVTKEDLDAELKAHPLRDPAKVQLAWIKVAENEKATVDSDLRSGTAFEKVAIKYSKAPNAEKMGGKFSPTPVPIANLAKQLQEAVAKTPQGRMTDWISTGDGMFAKFQVMTKEDEKDVQLTEPQRKLKMRQMAMQKGSQARDLKKKLSDRILQLVKDDKIKIVADQYKDMWKNLADQLKRSTELNKNAPATPGTTTPADTPKVDTTPPAADAPKGVPEAAKAPADATKAPATGTTKTGN